MLSISPTLETISLTANGALNIPATSLRGKYPAGTEAQLVFTNDSDITLLTLDGDFSSGKGITFESDQASVAGLPAGTHFVIYLTMPGEDQVAFRYGTVIRSEPRYPLLAPADTSNTALQFTADFSGTTVGPSWVPMGGSVSLAIHNNSLFSLPNSLGPNFALFNETSARWYAPLNMDSVSVDVNVITLGQGEFGYGVFNVILCADYTFSTYLGVQFYVDVIASNSYIQPITGAGPTTWAKQSSPIANQVVNGDTYSIKYNSLSNTLAVYKNTSLEPILSWVDNTNSVPHGLGFRYTGMSWQTSIFSAVVEPTAWQAHDGI